MYDEDGYRYLGKKENIFLTPHENLVLALLTENKGKIVTKQKIAMEIYGCELDEYIELNIRQKIRALRKKLKDECTIFTKCGLGYYLI